RSTAILREIPAPLPANTPLALRHIVDRCLEKEPGQRYQRASEVFAALEAVAPDAALTVGPTESQKTLSTRQLTLAAISLLTVLIVPSLALNVLGLLAPLFSPKPPRPIHS